MPNLSLILGLLGAAAILAWSLAQPGAGSNILDTHGLLLVVGGATAALLISTPLRQLGGALRALAWILRPGRMPTRAEVSAEVVRLAGKARAEGGLLALRGENPQFAGGFLQRAVAAAAACGETDAA